MLSECNEREGAKLFSGAFSDMVIAICYNLQKDELICVPNSNAKFEIADTPKQK